MSQKGYGMNSDDVKREGGILQDNARNLLTEITKLEKYNDSLRQIWKGSGSETYFSKWEEKKVSIKKLQSWLNNYGDSIVRAADLSAKTDSDVLGMMK